MAFCTQCKWIIILYINKKVTKLFSNCLLFLEQCTIKAGRNMQLRVCTSAGKGLNLLLWKPIQQPKEPGLSVSKCCTSTSSHLLLLQSELVSAGNWECELSMHSAGTPAARPAFAEDPNSHAVPPYSQQFAATSSCHPEPTVSQEWCSSVQPLLLRTKHIWSHCCFQHKKVTAEAGGFLWIWVERGDQMPWDKL